MRFTSPQIIDLWPMDSRVSPGYGPAIVLHAFANPARFLKIARHLSPHPDRHAELSSASIVPPAWTALVEGWTLKRVQGHDVAEVRA